MARDSCQQSQTLIEIIAVKNLQHFIIWVFAEDEDREGKNKNWKKLKDGFVQIGSDRH